MSERPKEHDWKSCRGFKRFLVGSNPTLSATEPRRVQCHEPREDTWLAMNYVEFMALNLIESCKLRVKSCKLIESGFWALCNNVLRNPPGPEGSNGKQLQWVPQDYLKAWLKINKKSKIKKQKYKSIFLIFYF